MKTNLILTSFVFLLFAACSGDSGESNNPNDPGGEDLENFAFKNTSWTMVTNGENGFSVLGVHKNGSTIAMAPSASNTKVEKVVFKDNPDSEGLHVWISDDGNPSMAFVNGNLVLFDNFSGTRVDMAIIWENGQTEILRNVEFGGIGGNPGFLKKNVQLSATTSLTDLIRWGGHALGIAACATTVAATLVSGGTLAPLTLLGCGAAIIGVAADVLIADNPAIEASSAALSAFASALTCSPVNISGCIGLLLSGAAAIGTAADNAVEARGPQISVAQNQLRGGGNIPTDGLVAYYPFNGNANDESGNGNDGSVNGATLTNDRFGNFNSAYFFDGIDDLISISPGDFNFGTGDFTIAAWVKADDIGRPVRIFSDRINCNRGEGGTALQVRTEGIVSADVCRAGDGDAARSTTNIFGNWVHVVSQRESSILRIFVNGNLENSTFSSRNANNSNAAEIGGTVEVGSRDQCLRGTIDEVLVYDRALSGQEIGDLSQN